MKSCNRVIVSVLVLLAGCETEAPDILPAPLISCSTGCAIPSTPPYGAPESGSTTWQVQTSQIAWSGGAWDVTIPVNAGDVVSSVSVVVRDNPGDAGNYVSLVLLAATPASIHQIGNVASDRSGTTQTLTMTPTTPHVVAANETLYIQALPIAPNPQYHLATVPSMIGAVTVTGSGMTPLPDIGTPQTMQIAPLTQIGNPVWNTTIGSGGIAVAIPMTIGAQITGLRARIADVAGMTFTLSLQSVGDGVTSTIATSAASAGTGSKQTLSLSGLAAPVSSGTAYQAVLTRVTGSGLSNVYWFEVDSQ